VNEHVVVCPHCGELSGVPTDPIAVAEISVMSPLEEPEPAPLPFLLENKALPPVEEEAEFPRAIARRRRD
jgi:hypothetical protein